MNRYRAISDTEFLRIVDIEFTEEDIQRLSTATKEEREAIYNELDAKFADVAIEGTELAEVDTVYNMFKPELKEGDVYELISFDIALDNGVEGVKMGAYNYKLNNKICNVIIK
jgi:phosphoribosylformimino-5-aminoimidazole carboxamide ribonucleotide (ProFAR) isomerase